MGGIIYYGKYTKDQVERANRIDLEELLRRNGEKLLPSGREKRLESDHSITVRGNRWFDHAAEQGGYALSFVRRHYGLSFAEGMKLLCDLSGVTCKMISGTADGEKHAWNLIKLDKEWYHADLTWDDPEPDETSRIMYPYFNVDDTQMKADHKWNAALYQKAEGNEYNYYRKKDLLCEDYKSFRSKCEDILEKKSPNSIQFMVKDYDQDTYSDDNLQFILRYSGASSLRMQIAGKTPYTMLYFKLQY